ncbi:hypothetical protein MHYP_G00198270 [Metynnis hypsauchen]
MSLVKERTEEMMDGSSAGAEDPSMEPSSRLFCCGWLRRCLPLTYREELYHILCMTGPLVASRILNYLLPFVITMFCGRLGNSELAGYGIASATISITTAATGTGLALACDTLVSQTFGRKNLLRVGMILQRGILILLLFCLPCWALLINTQPLLLLLGQDPEVARIAQLYVLVHLPAVPAMFLHQLQVAYLQNQGVILPQMYAAAAANIANVLTNYILIVWLDFGLYGSAAASALAEVYICVFLYAYIRWKRLHAETWGGWSLESLQEWGAYMKLAVPSTMMLCFEWWIYELGGFLAGMLSELDLAAQHTVMTLAALNYMFPLGIQGAACVRVGNALGAGDTAGAVLTCKVSLTCTAILAVLQGAVLASLKSFIGFIFTDDRQIVELVSKLLSVYCVLEFFDGLVCVCMGILLGSGQQKIAAVANLFGYYCIGLPLGISLMFAAKLEIIGFWFGLLICVCIQSTFFIIVIFKLNWERLTKQAIERAGKHKMSGMISDFESNPNRLIPESLGPTEYTSNNAENGNDYQAVSSRDSDDVRSRSVDQERLSISQEGARMCQDGGKSSAPLSTSQLIIRRGLITLAAVLIFAVGMSIHIIVPLPEVPHTLGANRLEECTAAAERPSPAVTVSLVRERTEEMMDGSSVRAEVPSMEPSSKMFCCGWLRRCLPLTYREELYHILRMTGPLLVCRFLNFLLFFVVTMFCGRLGNNVLAGYGMASATINVTTAATGLGLALACDTLVSQTFGSKNLLHVGVILQRGVLILLLFCLPCWALLINSQPLLLLLGQDPEVARIAQLYIVAYLPAVPAMFLYQLQLSYLQNQGVIFPQMYASLVANIVNVLANYVLLFWWDLGVHGSAAANSFAQVFSCVAIFAYIRLKKLHVKTWGGWSSESLQDWGAYMKLAIPSTLMTCFEWWIYEIGGFLAGMLGEVDLAAQHVVIMLAYINYMIPLGVQGAACVRVGNALGAGDTAGAILTSKVSLICAAVLAIIQGLVLGSTKTVIGFMFTSDESIAELVSELMGIYCPLQFFNGILCVGMGIVMGTGQQKIAAIANLFGYYCIGLPLSITLTFPAKLQVAGFWLGLLVTVFLLSIFFIVIIFKLNWKKMTEEAIERAGMGKNVTHTDFRSSNRLSDSFFLAVTNADIQNGNGYQIVSSRDQDEERRNPPAQESVSQEEGKSAAPLSTSQLIIRRGLTTLAAVVILAAGTAAYLILPLPEVAYVTNSTLDWGNFTSPPPFTTQTLSF